MHSHLHSPRGDEEANTNTHGHSRKNLQISEPAIIAIDEGPGNRVSNQGGQTDKSEVGTIPHTNLLDITNLRYTSRYHGHKGAGRKADNGGVDDNFGVGVGWQPKAEGEDSGASGRDDNSVEATDFIGEHAGQDAAEEAGGIENGKQVTCETDGHAFVEGLEDDKVGGEEGGEEEHEIGDDDEGEAQLFEWIGEVGDLPGFGVGWETRADEDDANAEETEVDEGNGAHRPSEAGAAEDVAEDDAGGAAR